MNKPDNLEEKELALFFSEWKEEDKKRDIPEFEYEKKSDIRIWKWLPLGIAAAFLVGFWMQSPKPKETDLEGDMVIITFIEDENQEQQFVIEVKSSLDVWEPQSSSLLTEF
ncbi:hypothetical protein [Shivajiella indica]|uniref:Uncharacterized protein n=1 Tax=Shivajiella indica TaxID=872115 RepID=A0ABW5B2J8_9BACT